MKNKIIVLLLSGLFVGVAVIFRQQLVSTVGELIVPVISVEENICDRIDPSGMEYAEISLDAGHTWQLTENQGELCSYYIDQELLLRSMVLMRIMRENGQTELWQIRKHDETLLSQSAELLQIDVPDEGSNFLDSIVPGTAAIYVLAVGCVVILLFFLFQAREQTRLLAEIHQTGELTWFLLQKQQRMTMELSALPGGAVGWISARVRDGFGVNLEISDASIFVLERYPLIQAISLGGDTIVISTLPRKQLLRRFDTLSSGHARSRLNRLGHDKQARVVVKKGKVFRHSLGYSGQTFDIEARLLAEALDFNWGQPDFLYFYAN